MASKTLAPVFTRKNRTACSVRPLAVFLSGAVTRASVSTRVRQATGFGPARSEKTEKEHPISENRQGLHNLTERLPSALSPPVPITN